MLCKSVVLKVEFMNIRNISSAEQFSSNIVKNKKITKPLKILVPGLLAGLGISLKTQPVKDTFETNNTKEINSKIFLNDVIQSTKSDEILKTHNFKQYKKSGIPLEYSRKNFVTDINNEIKNLSSEEKKEILSKYNLRLGLDIDGIAKLPQNTSNKEQNIYSAIEKYYNNSSKIQDKQTNQVINKIIKGMPEFAMTIGKEQHGTHIYSVDIHTLEVLQKSLNHPEYEGLSDDGKGVLKLAVLMHDFGKNGKVVTTGHAKQSTIDAKMVLQNYNMDESIKKRVLNLVENHHWFESFNKGEITSDDVKDIFKTPEDLKIAKIMAKGDLESISEDFHRYILHYGKFLTQKEFDTEFAEKMDRI